MEIKHVAFSAKEIQSRKFSMCDFNPLFSKYLLNIDFAQDSGLDAGNRLLYLS